jgi:antitoxin ParD1/3/4
LFWPAWEKLGLGLLQQLVDTGLYGSKSEVLREGVRLQDRETRLAALDASIIRGIADADAGRTKPASDVFDRLEAKYRAMADKAEKRA